MHRPRPLLMVTPGQPGQQHGSFVVKHPDQKVEDPQDQLAVWCPAPAPAPHPPRHVTTERVRHMDHTTAQKHHSRVRAYKSEPLLLVKRLLLSLSLPLSPPFGSTIPLEISVPLSELCFDFLTQRHGFQDT